MKINSREFKKLQKKWNKKLKDSGFEDIEQPDGNLKVWASHFFLNHGSEVQNRAKQEYYSMLEDFIKTYKFETKIDKFIVEKHYEGLSLKETEKLIRKKGIDRTHWWVHLRLKPLMNLMIANNKKINDDQE